MSHLDLGRREGSVSLGDKEDEGTVRKASTSSPPNTAFQPLGQNPARCPRGPSGAGPGGLLPSSSLLGPACVRRPGGLEGCAHTPHPHAHRRTMVVCGSCSVDANLGSMQLALSLKSWEVAVKGAHHPPRLSPHMETLKGAGAGSLCGDGCWDSVGTHCWGPGVGGSPLPSPSLPSGALDSHPGAWASWCQGLQCPWVDMRGNSLLRQRPARGGHSRTAP